jgi:diguanylate cyclase (GGDEF)-like protein/PAS domain S-box-containing protein
MRVGTVPPRLPTLAMSHSRLNQIYMYFVSAIGAMALVLSVRAFSLSQINLPFLILALATVLVGPRLSIPIPHVRAHISVSDSFIFLTLLLFGGEAAIIVATAEAVFASLRISKQIRVHLFNAAATAFSTFVTVWSLRLLFGETVSWHDPYSTNHLVAISAMAIIQYATNSLLIATSAALKSECSVWLTWRRSFLWTSITYFSGASAASLVAKFIGTVGFFAFVSTLPIVAIIYFTYWTYMKNVSNVAAQAQQAREHVEELNRHITEQERISKALRETEEHFRNAFDYAAIGMALVSPQGAWLRVNRSLCELIGFTEEEMLASNFQALTHADDLDNDLANLYRLIQGETPTCQVEKRYFHRSGNTVWALNNVSLVRQDDGTPVHFIFQIQDITERKRFESALQNLSLIDELTGLYNRRGFMAVTAQHLAAIRRNKKVPVILYADLDGLKKINDALGHQAGDAAIIQTAEILKDTFRTSDIVARLGGDEFVVLAAIDKDESADSLTDRLQLRFELYNEQSNAPYKLSISVGVMHFDIDEDSIEEVTARADRNMYEVKRRKQSQPIPPEILKLPVEITA